MEGDSDAAGRLSRISPPLSSVSPPITSLPQPQPNSAPTAKQRRMFTVDLRPGETTVVSWKKLIKESGSGNGEDLATMESKPALEAGPVAGPGGEDLKHTLQPPNCFSTVIEKIERLYMGNESSDEEELIAPDDEQYDTEDSFIDDTELDEYFKVDKLSTKHNGYFVNRGKLEWNESNPSPKFETKKRRRKDSAEIPNEIDHEHAKRGNTKMKAAARSVPLVAKSLNPGKVVTSFGEHHQEEKHLKIKPNASPVIYKKQSADFAIDLDVPPSTRIPDKDVSSVKLEPKDVGKNKSLSSKGLYKSSCTSESLDAIYQTSQEKAVVSQVEPQPKKLFNFKTELEQLPKIRCKDRYGTCEYPQISSSITSYPAQTIVSNVGKPKNAQTLSNRVSEVTVRPKVTTLERAIQELKKIVALSRPPNPAVQEVDPTVQGTKRRLPQEVKQKLAKVARLSVPC
ncbi:ubinuclein-1 isoform X2 [Dendrobium catenatum]|uniref:ubinuclein-1 isoform X2 n=1 Tax=Dendrobium catenatum TaxID=906689 RepID=UPI00109FB89B|nr:ubinuclein-1 isoform X2 [Dendrobium catenatum]